jgi:hypothetical protein
MLNLTAMALPADCTNPRQQRNFSIFNCRLSVFQQNQKNNEKPQQNICKNVCVHIK